VAIRFITTVRPSISPSARNNWKIHIWVFFEKLPRKFKCGYFTWRHVRTFMAIFLWIRLRMANITDKHVTENQNTNFISNKNFFFSKFCRLWDDLEKYGTARRATGDNIIRRMCFACWIHKATNTHPEYIILLFRCSIDCTNAPQCYAIRTLRCQS